MRDEKGFFSRMFTPGTPPCAVLCALLGALTALLLLARGIWVTLLIAVCVAAGAFLGGVRDKKAFWQKNFGRYTRSSQD